MSISSISNVANVYAEYLSKNKSSSETASAVPAATTSSTDSSSSSSSTSAVTSAASKLASEVTTNSDATYTNSYGDTVSLSTGIVIEAAHGSGHKGMSDAILPKKADDSISADKASE